LFVSLNLSNCSAREKLRLFYDQFTSEDHVLVLINADPDAIASAMAVKRLLWRKTAAVLISNVNVIERPDNLAMVRLLGIKLIFYKEVNPADFTRIVLVDSQPDHHEHFRETAPQVIIDHHPETATEAAFADIRPKYGATASILTEYLKAAKIKPSAKLATGLFYAIKTDTSNFERQSLIEDMRAFQFLYRHANIALARRIDQAELRLTFLKYFQRALAGKRVRKERIFAHIGQVVNPDVCVLIADFFMRIESVNWSIVSGIYAGKLVVILRNDGIRKNAGTVAGRCFGALGSAGGHISAARAEIPLAEIKNSINHRDDKELTKWLIQTIEKGSAKTRRRPGGKP
jgi:nanoRNase/pAp phosphatase (c-di-AMP/oligoRNAs hydrolase)